MGALASIWHRAWTTDELAGLTRGTLVEHLDIAFEHIEADALVATMAVRDQTAQRLGFLHGGASLALAETVGSLASQMCIDREQFASVGLEINANHVRPVPKGQSVRATARPIHLGRQSHIWEIRIDTVENKLACIARLTTSIQPRAAMRSLRSTSL
jgi:uncharacterized protein (TIGR00369 family)